LKFENDLMTIPTSTADKNYYIDFEVKTSAGDADSFTPNLGGSGLVEGDMYPIYCDATNGL
jgi:hypothetical protein